MGEFRVIPGGSLPMPGVCRACGSPDRDCVDFGATDFEWAILICNQCFLGGVSTMPELNLVTRAYMEEQLAKVAVDTKMLDNFKQARANFRDSITSAFDSFDLFLLSDTAVVDSSFLGDKKAKRPDDGADKSAKQPKTVDEFL